MAKRFFQAFFAIIRLAQVVWGSQYGLDVWLERQVPFARQGVLNNIGPDGKKVEGAHAGVVVASPSKSDPDYFYTWTRDAALVFKGLVDNFLAGDVDLEKAIQNYVISQAILQTVGNPSGGLSTGGLGEPKFHVDKAEFTGQWGRPQADGPPLRAIAMIGYANHLIENGRQDLVNSIMWPVIQNDLSYVTERWNQTTFDLWEEVRGSSFFTTAIQFRALTEGNVLAQQLNHECAHCISQTPSILCFMQTYWSGSHIVSNFAENGRTGKDANSILTSNHLFDPDADCSDLTFQPCSAKALANHKEVTDTFRSYGINSGIPQGQGVAVGRYIEDVYMGGQPWYLATSAAAEQLYAALYQWNKLGSLSITDVSLKFFKDVYPEAATGDYAADSQQYQDITSAIKAYGDSYLSVVQKYTPQDGSMAEQFNRDDGTPVSATDLTWSYSALLGAHERRNGVVPPSWGAATVEEPPTPCSGGSATGSYVTPTATEWPAAKNEGGQLPLSPVRLWVPEWMKKGIYY